MDALGVGIIFFPGLEDVLQAGEELIDVVEVEPATLWRQRDDGYFHVDRKALDYVAGLPFQKLIHGVGFPVGGTVPPGPQSFGAFRETAGRLDPEFVSEHLSFNKVRLAARVADTGFLLPPLQSEEGVKLAVENIRLFQREVDYPFAFETPANYLKPVRGETGDGEFFARVAEQADCGILLDLHNLWCNQLNGRQPLMEVVDCLPLDRVWEVHLAGGDWLDGYWLDGHSGLVPAPLRDIAREVLPRLKNIKAFNFEIIPEYLQAKNLSVDDILSELAFMKELWQLPKKGSARVRRENVRTGAAMTLTPAQWEEALMDAIMDNATDTRDQPLSGDHGVMIYRQLIEKIRAGMFASTLPLTFRYLLLSIGEERTMRTARTFWRQTAPELFSSREAKQLADFIDTQLKDVPYLEEVMQYELANHRAQIEDRPQTVSLSFNPDSVFPLLGRGRLPVNIEPGAYEVTITV